MIRELKGPSLINIIEKIAKLPQVTSNPPSDKDSIYNIYILYIYTYLYVQYTCTLMDVDAKIFHGQT